jgi:hypothetical protein
MALQILVEAGEAASTVQKPGNNKEMPCGLAGLSLPYAHWAPQLPLEIGEPPDGSKHRSVLVGPRREKGSTNGCDQTEHKTKPRTTKRPPEIVSEINLAVVPCRFSGGFVTSGLGSSQYAAQLATGALANGDWPKLASLVGGQIASFGESCWLTDARLRDLIKDVSGREYHPESIARARRQLRDAKIIQCERVFPNGKLPTNAKYRRSSHGTTIKTFDWQAIKQKNPFTRRERRLRRMEQAAKARELGDIVKDAPRYTSAPAIVYRQPAPAPPSAFKDEIERIAADAMAAQALRAEREAARLRAIKARRAAQPDVVSADPPPL